MGNAESTEATNAGHLEEEVERDDVDENNVEDAGELKEELALEQEEEQPGQEANIPTEAVVNDQRQTDAEEVEDLAKTGYHVLKIREGSPADEAGFEPYFDYIVAVAGERLDVEDVNFIETLRANVNKAVPVILFNSKSRTYREVPIVPRTNWGGDGLLGCRYHGDAAQNIWHVLNVQPHSPAERAQLRAHTDYIIGSPSALLKEEGDFGALVERYVDRVLHLFVYNWETDRCREVAVTPTKGWGGEGLLGCDMGFGALHRIPRNKYSAADARRSLELEDRTRLRVAHVPSKVTHIATLNISMGAYDEDDEASSVGGTRATLELKPDVE